MKPTHLSQSDFVNKLQDLLCLSQASVYKKIRGEVPINIDELLCLRKEFKFSLDELMGILENHILIEFGTTISNEFSVENFIIPISSDLSTLSRIPNAQLYYTSQELPFFYYLKFEKLGLFKLYSLLLNNKGSFKEGIFDFEKEILNTKQELKDQLDTIYSNYCGLRRTEIWNINILTNTLNQIKYYFEAGFIKSRTFALELLDEFVEMMNYIEKDLDQQSKSEGDRFQLYFNEMLHTNNTILIINPIQSVIYSTFNNPQYFKITDPKMVDFTLHWIQNVIQKSNQLTNSSEKGRKSLFRKLNLIIDETKNQVINF